MNNMLNRKISIVFLLLLVVGMVLSACGEEATTPVDTAPPAATEAAPPPGATPDPNRGYPHDYGLCAPTPAPAPSPGTPPVQHARCWLKHYLSSVIRFPLSCLLLF